MATLFLLSSSTYVFVLNNRLEYYDILMQIDDCLINRSAITHFIISLNNLMDIQARIGGEDIGYGFRRDLKLISEVQAPFRGVRKFFYVALSAAAGISLLFTLPRLFRAIQGGDQAPDVWETAGNLAVNVGGTSELFINFHGSVKGYE